MWSLKLALLCTPALGALSVSSVSPWGYPDDTPAASLLSKDGKWYFSQAHALYGAQQGRKWSFFSGADYDSFALDTGLTNAVNASEPRDSNADTTFRCNELSPTGRESTYAPSLAHYSQRNFCDLVGAWVDPDTGDWIGLVHNEFTPQPFGSDGLHYDSIDRAISKDGGRTWTITEHVITSPFSTKRGDAAAFPHDTYYYGDGDPRIHFDLRSGFVYVFYNSRVVDKAGGWKLFYAHAARAPIKDKLRGFQKFHRGAWAEPGVGGRESVLFPTSQQAQGYSDVEYSPQTPGTGQQQAAAGTAPPTSPLFVMDVSFNAYLGKYIAEPQNPDQSGNAPQEFYVCDDLATQKWTLLGNTGDKYKTASWYRWFVDSVSKTSGAITGKQWRSYCSFGCMGGKSGDYATISLDATQAQPLQGSLAGYTVKPTGDGAYTLRTAGGQLVGVAERRWDSCLVFSSPAAPSAKEQWWLVPDAQGGYRAVNRWSTLVLAQNRTVPARHWDNGAARVADQVYPLL